MCVYLMEKCFWRSGVCVPDGKVFLEEWCVCVADGKGFLEEWCVCA